MTAWKVLAVVTKVLDDVEHVQGGELREQVRGIRVGRRIWDFEIVAKARPEQPAPPPRPTPGA